MYNSTNIRILISGMINSAYKSGVKADLAVGKSLWEAVCESMAIHRVSEEEMDGRYRIIHDPYGLLKVMFDEGLQPNSFEFQEPK